VLNHLLAKLHYDAEFWQIVTVGKSFALASTITVLSHPLGRVNLGLRRV
jgi:hypothetical protein